MFQILLMLSLMSILGLCVMIAVSHHVACRTGWVGHAQDPLGTTIRAQELFIRRGRIMLHSILRRRTGVTLAQQLENEPYNTQRPGWQWHTFPAEWTLPFQSHRSGAALDWTGIQVINIRTDPRMRALTRMDVRDVGIDFPAWVLLAPLLIAPGIWVGRLVIRRGRRQLGRCVTCGYDLRASPQRCPECGTSVPTTANSTARSRS